MTKRFQIRGDSNNPYHLSVGGVLIIDGEVFLLRKTNGFLTLPRETIYSDESVTDALKRGFIEELGIEVTVSNFLGSLITHFDRPDGSNIEKTTLYFLVEYVLEAQKNQAKDEIDDEIVRIELGTALKELREQGNEESTILKRV